MNKVKGLKYKKQVCVTGNTVWLDLYIIEYDSCYCITNYLLTSSLWYSCILTFWTNNVKLKILFNGENLVEKFLFLCCIKNNSWKCSSLSLFLGAILGILPTGNCLSNDSPSKSLLHQLILIKNRLIYS